VPPPQQKSHAMVALAQLHSNHHYSTVLLHVQKNLEHSAPRARARKALNETTTHSTFPAGIPYRNAHI
jgi:hypothetical protein